MCAIQCASFEYTKRQNEMKKNENPLYKCHSVIEYTFIGFESQNASQFGIDSKCLLVVRFSFHSLEYASIIGDVKCV